MKNLRSGEEYRPKMHFIFQQKKRKRKKEQKGKKISYEAPKWITNLNIFPKVYHCILLPSPTKRIEFSFINFSHCTLLIFQIHDILHYPWFYSIAMPSRSHLLVFLPYFEATTFLRSASLSISNIYFHFDNNV